MINKNLLKDTTTSGSSGAGRQTYTYTPFTYDDYTKSTDVINAEAKAAEIENTLANYGDFTYSNQGLLDDVMNRINNREKFSYDLNGDALYQQYKDKYIQQGKMAMADTMGQAAAMTGGYGNSYAATVGNQAYQASLQQLNDVIPELYQMAYDRYKQEGQDLYNQYGLYSNERNTEYGMWVDGRNNIVADRGYYSNEVNNAFNRDYGMYLDNRNLAYDEHTTTEGYKYQDIVDTNAYNQWKATYDQSADQFNRTMAFNVAQANKTVPKDTTMSTEDYSYWSDKFSNIKSDVEAQAMRDQMAIAVGDTEMAYELYYQWEKSRPAVPKLDTSVAPSARTKAMIN